MLAGICVSIAVFVCSFAFLSICECENDCRWKTITPCILIYILAASVLSTLQIKVSQECYLPGCALCGYIAYSAWTDSRDKYIYALPFLILLIVYSANLTIIAGSISVVILWLLMMSVFYFLCCKVGNMGKGDMYVIAGIFLILPFYNALICIGIAAVIFIASNLKKINWKKARINEKQAFIPSLTAALIITMMIL